jgi:ankyrin repeat protein
MMMLMASDLYHGASIEQCFIVLHHLQNRVVYALLLLDDDGANMEHQNQDEWTALFFVFMMNCVHVAQLLLDGGANIEHLDKNGATALFMASLHKYKLNCVPM